MVTLHLFVWLNIHVLCKRTKKESHFVTSKHPDWESQGHSTHYSSLNSYLHQFVHIKQNKTGSAEVEKQHVERANCMNFKLTHGANWEGNHRYQPQKKTKQQNNNNGLLLCDEALMFLERWRRDKNLYRRNHRAKYECSETEYMTSG